METATALCQQNAGSEPYASYQLTNFIDDAVRKAFVSPKIIALYFLPITKGQKIFKCIK